MSEFGRREGSEPRRVLAISSSGGHWTELLRLAPALQGHDVTWCTTNKGYRDSVPFGAFEHVRDASMWNKRGLVIMFGQIAALVVRLRPEVVITTGAAPGFFAIRVANLVGSHTIWLDSIANADELSLSGRRIGGHADVWLTQWEHLAAPQGPLFKGSVI